MTKSIAAAAVFIAVSPLAGMFVPVSLPDYCTDTPMGNQVCGGNFNPAMQIDLRYISVYRT